ncbi:hypothetical protein C8R42DRAFT_641014 [Lentinula raphanica]|nr:hypothetical protein C8R42DRAFT_641014 [Lentinula raphanica]
MHWKRKLESANGRSKRKSEEEDGSRTMIIDNRRKTTKVKIIKVMICRHPAIGNIFQDIDNVREAEAQLFSETGKVRMPRIRLPEINIKKMKAGLSHSVWHPEYLASLQPFQLNKLKIDRRTFNFYERPTFNNNTTA